MSVTLVRRAGTPTYLGRVNTHTYTYVHLIPREVAQSVIQKAILEYNEYT